MFNFIILPPSLIFNLIGGILKFLQAPKITLGSQTAPRLAMATYFNKVKKIYNSLGRRAQAQPPGYLLFLKAWLISVKIEIWPTRLICPGGQSNRPGASPHKNIGP